MGLQPFELVVQRHGAMVMRVCRAVVGPQAAEDAWSETFLSALKAYPDLPDDADVAAWLVTIAHRKAIDQVRAEARRPAPVESVPETGRLDAERPGSWERDLWDALKALPLKQRECVAYHHLVGLPYAQIALVVGGTPEAARRAAADGIAVLRRTYTAEGSRT